MCVSSASHAYDFFFISRYIDSTQLLIDLLILLDIMPFIFASLPMKTNSYLFFLSSNLTYGFEFCMLNSSGRKADGRGKVKRGAHTINLIVGNAKFQKNTQANYKHFFMCTSIRTFFLRFTGFICENGKADFFLN